MKQKKWQVLLLLIIVLAGCRDKSMSLEELKTAKWFQLDKGIDYINLKNGQPHASDTIRYSVKGYIGPDIMALADLDNTNIVSDSLLNYLLLSKLPRSRHGYIRLDLYELVSRPILTATVYLRDSYDTTALARDLQMIRQLPGVTDAVFISKDAAAQKFLADGNADWKNVLEENPLPSSIDFYFDRDSISPQQYEKTGDILRENMLGIGDIHFPEDFAKKWEGNYFIMEYKKN